MAISPNKNYSTSAQGIITEALELLGVLGEGESPTQDQYTSCLRTLNMMVKTWQADGLNLFAVDTLILFLEKGVPRYTLSADTTNHIAVAKETIHAKTTATSAAGDSEITLDSVTGLEIGYQIGIWIEGNDMFWTQVQSIVNNVVGLASNLPADITENTNVYAYPSAAWRPMRVLEAYRRTGVNTDIPLDILSRVDYWSLSTKKVSQGTVNQIYFDPQIGYDNLYVWTTSATAQDQLILLVQKTLSNFDSLSDEPDYPQEWFMPLCYGLAVRLAPKYGTPAMDYQRLQVLAYEAYEMARGWDVEQETSTYLKPDNWGSTIGRRGG